MSRLNVVLCPFLLAASIFVIGCGGEALTVDVQIERGQHLELRTAERQSVRYSGLTRFRAIYRNNTLTLRQGEQRFSSPFNEAQAAVLFPVLNGMIDGRVEVAEQDLEIESQIRQYSRQPYVTTDSRECRFVGPCTTCLPTYGYDALKGEIDTDEECRVRVSTNCPGHQSVEVRRTELVTERIVRISQRGREIGQVVRQPTVRNSDEFIRTTGSCH